nr:RNA-directed DNA polymerase, eukaryota, reverse transcriptase zinc-binding domain protein [Tanacetum cinerariifolium]
MAIRGVLAEGEWVVEPAMVKKKFFNHFSNRFAAPISPKISIHLQFPKRLSLDHNEILERTATYDEIKKAVRDCGTNKSSGPDGFSFEFFRQYWGIIDQDVVVVNTKAMIFKVDFEKSFDSIRWDFFDEMLHKFGFGDKWRGLKQGDPLSAFLFILIMERLHVSFENVLNAGLYKGIRLDDSLSLSHLFYTDDVVFVGKWDKLFFSTIFKVLKWFFLASGLKINIHKSKLMGIGIPQDVVASTASSIGCATLTPHFNYLGVKVGGNMSRLISWDEVIAKISSRLSKWKLKTLSVCGRYTLIKLILGSLPLNYFSIFKVPKGILNKMESFHRNFFNGVDIGERKMSLIGWKHILASKKNGGLGISSLFALNRALLFKWIWHFITNGSSLWSRVFNVFCGNRGAINIIHNSSRRSPWLDIICEFKSLSSIDKSYSVTIKVRDTSLIASFRRPPRGGIEVDQLRILGDIISLIVLSNSNDRWLWRLDSARVFSVKSAHCYIDESFLPKVEVSTIWIVYIPIKVNIFARKFCLDKLPTRLNLFIRGLDIPLILCPNCYIAVESTMHILFSCDLARQLMRKVTRWFPKVLKDVFEGVCYVMWWVIWKYHNQVLFGNIIPRMDLLFDEISRLSYSWASSRGKSLSIDWNVWIKNPSSLSL